ncbi:hypothetical protein [Natrinema versiforme]|uniref:DUF8069 domain-containing protein n=1 Tax=Natrinema versiforme TaxID=88724 RepID=A0A4P8WLK3_9EURY|nr:hypothetical protein FEJ81_19125 [Natrinema versiforme]
MRNWLLSKPQDGERVSTKPVSDIVGTDVVTPIPEGRVLVHEPSGTAFDSITQLAVCHRGWTAARDADAEAE